VNPEKRREMDKSYIQLNAVNVLTIMIAAGLGYGLLVLATKLAGRGKGIAEAQK